MNADSVVEYVQHFWSGSEIRSFLEDLQNDFLAENYSENLQK